MGKLKKTKEKDKTEPSSVVRVSRKTTLKPKKTDKPKKVAKKIKLDIQPATEKNKSTPKPAKKTVGPFNIEQFEKGIDVLLQYIEKNESKDLFTREKPIFLQIDAIKIPKCPNRRIRLPLKHTLLTDKQEVCLIVPDLKKGRRIDHEPTIEHYEELLRSKNVQSIKRIIPIRQLKVEYDQFELKRRLCGYYDYFLVAGNISGHVSHLLGKIFIEKRKAPIPIKIQATNLVETIEDALKKATINIHSKGMSYIVQFGHSEMTPDQLLDNLISISEKLDQEFPGSFGNIRSLHIKTNKSISIPVYYSLKTPNTVPVPVIKPPRPKNYEKVTGELTTKLSGNSDVTVHPGGRIEYEKKQIGPTKNQLRKISQGRVQKRSAFMRKRKEKLKLKKLKKEAKNKDKIKNISKDVTVKTEKKTKKQKIKKENSEQVTVKQEKPDKIKVKSEKIDLPKQKPKKKVSKRKTSKTQENSVNGFGKTKKKKTIKKSNK